MPFTSRLAVRAAAGFLVLTLGCWCLLHFTADRWAGPTLALFGPRWLIALPLVVLVPLGIATRSYRSLALSGLAAILAAGPITGGQIGIGRMTAPDRPARTTLRIVTWNSGAAKLGPAFRQFIDETQPEILVCQESALSADDLPGGWKVVGAAGNRIATPLPVRHERSFDFLEMGVAGRLERCIVTTQEGDVTLVNLHLPTPRPGFEAAIRSKLLDLSELRNSIEVRADAARVARRWIGPETPNAILAGDFNMPVESRIYRDTWSGFRNAFSESGTGWGTTKQTRWFGSRIDHILYTADWTCRAAWTGPALGSDHRPLIAELSWMGPEK